MPLPGVGSGGGDTIRVLLVEDDPDQAEIVRRALRRHEPPFEVTVVGDGAAGLDAVALRPYSIVLLDYSLPRMNGLEVLGRIRERGIQVPVVMVTGQGDERIAVDAIKAGALDYVIKTQGYLTTLPTVLHKALRQHAMAFENSRLYHETQRAYDELSQTQDQLVQASKMEAVGHLAGGVAHDFNNLLMVIMGRTELLLAALGSGDPNRSVIELIEKTAHRAADLTRQLLAFSRKQVLQPAVLDLNTVVSNMSEMLRRLIGEDITLITVLGPALGRVKADPGQIEQIIMNLAVNARDAMPHGGRLTLETANVDLDAAYARKHVSARPGPHIMLALSDTGIGMDPKTQARIFEPFFTTKGPRKGTGLGLAMVYGIVKQSGGNIWVYSELGQGTTFKIYLPQIEEPIESAQGRSALAPPLRGVETVLLVEDEDAVRDLARDILQARGYTVLEARHGAEALRISEQHPGPIHLMLTDVVMPEMTGRVLAGRLAALRPETKVLYMSGYTDNAVVHHGVLDPGTVFLQKPFTGAVLARKVREMLDSRAVE